MQSPVVLFKHVEMRTLCLKFFSLTTYSQFRSPRIYVVHQRKQSRPSSNYSTQLIAGCCFIRSPRQVHRSLRMFVSVYAVANERVLYKTPQDWICFRRRFESLNLLFFYFSIIIFAVNLQSLVFYKLSPSYLYLLIRYRQLDRFLLRVFVFVESIVSRNFRKVLGGCHRNIAIPVISRSWTNHIVLH